MAEPLPFSFTFETEESPPKPLCRRCVTFWLLVGLTILIVKGIK